MQSLTACYSVTVSDEVTYVLKVEKKHKSKQYMHIERKHSCSVGCIRIHYTVLHSSK